MLEWVHNYERSIKEGIEFIGTLDAFYLAIKTAIPYIQDIAYDPFRKDFQLSLNFKDGKKSGRKQLSYCSDGVIMLFNLVAEIAYRCILLNGRFGESAVRFSNGIIIIDELDLLLHPKWQNHVVANLTEAFPNIQFIVTSHSEFIIQSLEKDQLINLDETETLLFDFQNYGIEEIAEKVMGVPDAQRSQYYKEKAKLAEEYFTILKNGIINPEDENVRDIKKRLDEIELKTSHDPAFVGYLKAERNSYVNKI